MPSSARQHGAMVAGARACGCSSRTSGPARRRHAHLKGSSVIDVGANVSPKPEHLPVRRAGMILAKHALQKRPRLACNIGSEEAKGTTKCDTHALFNASHAREPTQCAEDATLTRAPATSS